VAHKNQDITRLLKDVHEGRGGALDDLMKAVYDDLQHVAERHMTQRFGHNLPGVTMEPAALVNESFMMLIRQRKAYDNRGQFFAIATRMMLRVLVDYRRKHQAAKRGGAVTRIRLVLDERQVAYERQRRLDPIELEELAEALKRLESLDPRKAEVVKMRVVWGLRVPEIAESLGVSASTVERDWRFAKAWLADQVGLMDRA